MLTLTQCKEGIEEVGRRGVESLLRSVGEEVVEAALDCDVQWEDIEEAYIGQFDSNQQFAEHLVSDDPSIKELPSYIYIDWDRTARDLMMEYGSSAGHYFRSL